jgi:hypothetical protein
MNWNEKSSTRRGWILRAIGLCLIATFAFVGRENATGTDREPHGAANGASALRSVAAAASEPLSVSSSPVGDHFQVKSYVLDFAGDHSLNAATVTERAMAGRAHYTVQLRLASGAEQSVVVAAPPGGLQIEMHDMTGDHVQNDVVLWPALLSWPPTVLVNDGHDHFAVVVSGADPGNFSSSENLGSLPRNGQTFAFLRSSGFKAIHVPNSKRMVGPESQQGPFSPFSQSFARGTEHASSSGRAPPFVTTI